MSLRDRLRARQLPQATIGLRMDWSAQSYDIHNKLEAARNRLQLAEVEDWPDVEELRTAVHELEARVDALYEYVTVQALPASDMEALIAQHPPKDDQKGFTFNPETFYPALLAACVEGPETADDWNQMINSRELVIGEVNALVRTAMELNDRSPNVIMGKGLTTTPS